MTSCGAGEPCRSSPSRPARSRGRAATIDESVRCLSAAGAPVEVAMSSRASRSWRSATRPMTRPPSLLDEALDAARAGGADVHRVAQIRGNQGLVALFTGCHAAAERAFRDEFEHGREGRFRNVLPEGLLGLAGVAAAAGSKGARRAPRGCRRSLHHSRDLRRRRVLVLERVRDAFPRARARRVRGRALATGGARRGVAQPSRSGDRGARVAGLQGRSNVGARACGHVHSQPPPRGSGRRRGCRLTRRRRARGRQRRPRPAAWRASLRTGLRPVGGRLVAVGSGPARHRNPVTDTTGAACAAGQPRGPVWFLAGTFGGDPVTRTCRVPSGRALLFPVANNGYFAFLDDPPEQRTEAFVRSIARQVTDATTAHATIDGCPRAEHQGALLHRIAAVSRRPRGGQSSCRSPRASCWTRASTPATT